MKLIGIVGSNAEVSYNRLLLKYMEKQFKTLVDIELIEIKDVPMFNQDDDQTESSIIQKFNRKISYADGVIIATPEHNRTITPSLKSFLEWLSFKIHPLENKPVMIVGASYYDQGSSRAQLHLRQILEAPGVNAMVMPGNEFLLGKVKSAFDDSNNLKDEKTKTILEETLKKFMRYVEVVSVLEGPKKPIAEPEDLFATGKIATTIEGIEMAAEDWVEQAAEKVNAVSGNDYVNLNRGILTVDQLNYFLASIPMELTFADSNNQFIYYNRVKPREEMLAGRTPAQVGNALAYCHPESTYKGVEWVIQQLRTGAQELVKVHIPTGDSDSFVVHNYQAMYDDNGEYAGLNEYVFDYQPLIDFYLQQTGQKLIGDIDAVSGASESSNDTKADAVSGASESTNETKVDAVSGASENK
ncbi:NAD(P)H-dependent oxidoreductase [Vagococcus silagei]|uniref:NADPH-dependent oxidoreductase n=1 Tax=Vagococcus silagei TaxID=2508885 RepID=A0A4S3AZI3_9ENTE|nr:NAD(P)H-dependent oxidoreductase [Vagococcus silagei]THB60151.1 NADPH-dependent oxidoreductase [Vagococcus silagei]